MHFICNNMAKEGSENTYPAEGKGDSIRDMFNNIAWRYDILNTLFTLGIDKIWRRRAIALLGRGFNGKLLDVATGTADLAIEAYRQYRPGYMAGLDVSEEMMAIGRKKAEKYGIKNMEFFKGMSESMPFDNGYFDGVICGFGVRNFSDLDRGLAEMARVLTNNGRVVILEFSKSQNRFFRNIFKLYFSVIMPFIGRIISKDRQAYSYLPESVERFPAGNDFVLRMENAGFTQIKTKTYMFGQVSVYSAQKP